MGNNGISIQTVLNQLKQKNDNIKVQLDETFNIIENLINVLEKNIISNQLELSEYKSKDMTNQIIEMKKQLELNKDK